MDAFVSSNSTIPPVIPQRMLFSLWLGMVIAAGESGCTTIKKPNAFSQLPAAQMQQQAPPMIDPNVHTKSSAGPVRGLRNPDFDSIPKVPPAGARIVYNSTKINAPYIAITFDDGPQPKNTPRLLDMLRERNIKATFFVVGSNAREYPAIIRRILAEGHEIGNHTLNHLSLPTLSAEKVAYQLGETDRAVVEASGYHMHIMRPPYGATNLHIKQYCYDQMGTPTILWDVDPFDWKKPGSSVVRQRIVSGTRNGSIILCHDIHASTIDAMPDTLDTLLARGFKFVTVSQLMNIEASANAVSANANPSAATKEAAPAAPTAPIETIKPPGV